MPRRFRPHLILWLVLGAAAPPPGLISLLVEGMHRDASGSTDGTDPAGPRRPTQARGRNRVNAPARPDACLTSQHLAGDERPGPPSDRRPGTMAPRRAGLPAAGPIPFRPTSHRLRC